MTVFQDARLGEIKVRRLPQATHIRFKLSPKGEIIVTAPTLTPLFVIKQALKSSYKDLSQIIDTHRQDNLYSNGQMIGKSHKLVFVDTDLIEQPTIDIKNRHLVLSINSKTDPDSPAIQQLIQASVIKVLRKEAKAYLPRRLKHLAERHNFSYQSIRFTHTGSRWGSCSSQGTISLNIALMKLPLELIDYVLIHELCHTKQMNHSPDFWRLVEDCLPNYQPLRKQLKKHTPSL